MVQQLESQLGAFDAGPCLPPQPPLVVIISGPSGVGKDAVISALRARCPDLHFVVTATSRWAEPHFVHSYADQDCAFMCEYHCVCRGAWNMICQ